MRTDSCCCVLCAWCRWQNSVYTVKFERNRKSMRHRDNTNGTAVIGALRLCVSACVQRKEIYISFDLVVSPQAIAYHTVTTFRRHFAPWNDFRFDLRKLLFAKHFSVKLLAISSACRCLCWSKIIILLQIHFHSNRNETKTKKYSHLQLTLQFSLHYSVQRTAASPNLEIFVCCRIYAEWN